MRRRETAYTDMNHNSSRSHLIFTLCITQSDTQAGATLRSRLHLVDLAGSERLKRSMDGSASGLGGIDYRRIDSQGGKGKDCTEVTRLFPSLFEDLRVFAFVRTRFDRVSGRRGRALFTIQLWHCPDTAGQFRVELPTALMWSGVVCCHACVVSCVGHACRELSAIISEKLWHLQKVSLCIATAHSRLMCEDLSSRFRMQIGWGKDLRDTFF